MEMELRSNDVYFDFAKHAIAQKRTQLKALTKHFMSKHADDKYG